MQKFSDISYRRPDMSALKRSVRKQLRLFRSATSFEEAKSAYLAAQGILKHVETSYVVASIRNTLDTTDKFYDGEMKFFNRASAMLLPLSKAFIEALLITPFRSGFEAEFGKQLFVLAEIQKKTRSKKIIVDMIRQGNAENEYKKTAAACKTTFRGEECNFYGLLKHMESADRGERREAYLAWAKLYEDASGKLDAQFDRLVKIRVGMAKKLRLPGGFTELGYLNMNRAD